ncbi:MAG: anthranilate synthase component I family protein, partial [Pedobacter sp.]
CKRGPKLISQPIKGTARRSDNPSEDENIKIQLRNDVKEQSENVMIVDLVRHDLTKSAVKGSVRVEELFGIYSFPHVHQMISTISCQLDPDVHFIDAIRNAFPMGSMTGAPKVKAMQLIEQYEKTKRGVYSGSFGCISPNGDFDFNVVIRSILYNAANKYLSFQVGGAITYQCDPEKEYDECLLKASAILKVLGSR